MVNIFAVDSDPIAAARALYDKHIIKMPIESLQMLSSIHRVCDGVEVKDVTSVAHDWKGGNVKNFKRPRTFFLLPRFGEEIDHFNKLEDDGTTSIDRRAFCQVYLMAHRNHPSTIWARTTRANYKWLSDHTQSLFNEYSYRYGKLHNSYSLFQKFLRDPPHNIPNGPLTPFALAMKSFPQCVVDDPVESYRNYYRLKPKLLKYPMKWKKRNPPPWFTGETNA